MASIKILKMNPSHLLWVDLLNRSEKSTHLLRTKVDRWDQSSAAEGFAVIRWPIEELDRLEEIVSLGLELPKEKLLRSSCSPPKEWLNWIVSAVGK